MDKQRVWQRLNLPLVLKALSQVLRRLVWSSLSRVMCTEMAGCSMLYHGPLLQGELFECMAATAFASMMDSSEGPV